MTNLKPGDKISCRIQDNTIVTPFKEAECIKVFEIIGVSEFGYYIFIPQYVYIKSSKTLDVHQCKKLKINPRFVDEQMDHITVSQIHQVVQELDGMCCCVCHEFIPMGAPNQEDKTLVCWVCRARGF